MDKFYRCYYCEGIIKVCYIDHNDRYTIICPICKQENTLQRTYKPVTIKHLKETIRCLKVDLKVTENNLRKSRRK